jgi:hypothetical protein
MTAVIRDFKKSLNERVTPRTLAYLNWMISFFIIVSLAMAAIGFD